MSKNTYFTIIQIMWVIFAAFALCVIAAQCRHSVRNVTHDECVAYWTNRTASWDNVPSIAAINNDAVFCGDVA